MNAAEVRKLPIQDGHTSSLFAVQTGSWNNIVPRTGLFSYTGGKAFCCAGNSSYNVTCCNDAFTFSQNDIGRPFMPGFVNASTITTGTASTVTSTALSTVTALSGGVSAQTVGLALGIAAWSDGYRGMCNSSISLPEKSGNPNPITIHQGIEVGWRLLPTEAGTRSGSV
jgi:hypothetical protein